MKKNQTIYYLDVESEDLSFFKQTMEGLGHKISIYNDGNIMIYDLNIIPTKPDILFLCNRIPHLDDQELIQLIKNNEEWKEISLVLVSRIFQKKLLQQYRDLGVNLVMKRPIRSNYSIAYGEVLQMDFGEPLKYISDVG